MKSCDKREKAMILVTIPLGGGGVRPGDYFVTSFFVGLFWTKLKIFFQISATKNYQTQEMSNYLFHFYLRRRIFFLHLNVIFFSNIGFMKFSNQKKL